MLTYLRYLLVPSKAKLPEIRIVNRSDESVAFRCKQDIEPGVQRLCTRTSKGSIAFDVDVYHFDERHAIYEGRVIAGSQELLVEPWTEDKPQEVALFGNLEERFVQGARVSTSRPVQPGAILRVEIDGQSPRLAEVLWSQKVLQDKYDVRISFREPSQLRKLSKGRYCTISS